MVIPEFQRVKGTDDLELSAFKVYEIPLETMHLGIKNGKIGFFVSEHKDSCKSTNNRWFVKIPDEPRSQAVAFPQFERRAEGCYYGCPRFLY